MKVRFGLSRVIRGIPYLFLTAILVVLPWFWIPEGFAYIAEEPNFINYDIKLETSSTFWVKEGLGRDGDPANQSLLIPNAYFYRLARNLGLNMSDTQKLYLSFVFISTSLSFGIFSSLFTKRSLVRCLGLLVYLINFYFVTSLGYTAKMFQLVLMPLIFYLTVSYLKSKRLIYLLVNYIMLFSFQSIFTNFPTAFIALSMYFFAFVYHLLSKQYNLIRNSLRYFGVLLLSITPVLLVQGFINWSVVGKVGENPASFAFTAIGAPILNLFQFRGVWWEKSGHLGIDYLNLWQFYGNPLVVITTALGIGAIVFTILLTLENEKRSQKTKSFFWLSLYLFGIGLASGFYFIPGFYLWMVQNIPGMIMFRETWAKFIPLTVFSFSAMTLITIDKLNKQKSKVSLIILVLISLMITVQSYPFVSGTIIDSRSIDWKRRLVKIPDYWLEYGQWSQTQEGVILPIPYGTDSFNFLYLWYDNQGNSTDPIPCILGTNVICKSMSHVDRFGTLVGKSIEINSLDFLVWGGVDYMMVQKDMEILGDHDLLGWQEKAVASFVNPEPIAAFGNKLFIYSLKDEYRRPKIYIAHNLSVDGEKSKNILHNDVYYSSKTSAPLSDRLVMTNLSTSFPDITYEKISQVQYRVKVSQANNPYVMVLGENFSNGWKILRGDYPKDGFPGILAKLRRFFTQSVVDEKLHFVANGYANGWYIEKPVDGVLTIVYQPDDLFSLLSLLSTISFSTACLFSILLIFKAPKS